MTMSQQPTYLLTTTCLANAVAIQFATQTAVIKNNMHTAYIGKFAYISRVKL